MDYFLGDTHFGHSNILKYGRKHFNTIEEHDEFILDNINSVVDWNDKLYLMGDIVFKDVTFDILRSINTQNITVVLGNHDWPSKVKASMPDFVKVAGCLKYKGQFWLSHVPLHPSCLGGLRNIHGHLHEYKIEDPRYFNTSCEQVNYTPISIAEIKNWI